tara:strand:- start:606 stop:1319 length:714 start_codon:yes stop_codon:yes gene_type:complete
MALTRINTKSVETEGIEEHDLKISNTASDGQYLQYKDSSDKLTWSTVTTTPADDSITTAMIQDDAITADKLANNLSDVRFGDSSSVVLGEDADMILYSSGGNGVIRAYLNNKITIASANAQAGVGPDDLAVFNANGSVELYHNNVKKVETSATGVTVTGTVAATAVTGDGSGLTGIDAGATGGGTDKIFWENGTTIDTDYTVGTTFGAACNAMSAGPITINTGKTVTVDAGDTWTIV